MRKSRGIYDGGNEGGFGGALFDRHRSLIIHLRKKVGLRFMKFDGAGGTT
jgi:hypothetical protein